MCFQVIVELGNPCDPLQVRGGTDRREKKVWLAGERAEARVSKSFVGAQ
jgi:hypothetical protein